jgi:hypothetical protein
MARQMILLGERFEARRTQSWGRPEELVSGKDLMLTSITLDPETAEGVGAFSR